MARGVALSRRRRFGPRLSAREWMADETTAAHVMVATVYDCRRTEAEAGNRWARRASGSVRHHQPLRARGRAVSWQDSRREFHERLHESLPWRDGKTIKRWCPAAMLKAERSFR